MSNSEMTFQLWGRTYKLTDEYYGDPVKSDDTDSISSIQIALTNAQYAGDVTTSISEGQRLLANLLRLKLETGRSVAYVEEISDSEPESPWKAEVFWAVWYNYQYI
ncbi:hypothetical protein A3B64_00435 [candidate division WWE3 bacterium RIFCSPLOWO2_01_FULL_37_24]|nr:MAG: hypothetical protein A3B64_00435 [candidate division WWE3 bacterium RIFCSPLOWO2_01_FULL_37_24]